MATEAEATRDARAKVKLYLLLSFFNRFFIKYIEKQLVYTN